MATHREIDSLRAKIRAKRKAAEAQVGFGSVTPQEVRKLDEADALLVMAQDLLAQRHGDLVTKHFTRAQELVRELTD